MLYEVIDLCSKNTVLVFKRGAKLIVIQETQNHWVPSSPHLVH